MWLTSPPKGHSRSGQGQCIIFVPQGNNPDFTVRKQQCSQLQYCNNFRYLSGKSHWVTVGFALKEPDVQLLQLLLLTLLQQSVSLSKTHFGLLTLLCAGLSSFVRSSVGSLCTAQLELWLLQTRTSVWFQKEKQKTETKHPSSL